MNEGGHRQAVEELRRSQTRLVLPDDIRAYAEVSFGIGFHLIAVGCERRHRQHRENHEGLARWLRGHGHGDVARLWEDLEHLRVGHWYGRQGNGDAAARADALVAEIEAWAMAEGAD